MAEQLAPQKAPPVRPKNMPGLRLAPWASGRVPGSGAGPTCPQRGRAYLGARETDLDSLGSEEAASWRAGQPRAIQEMCPA